MIKWIVILVAGWLLIKLISGDRKKKAAQKEQEVKQQQATGEMVKDPICGAFVAHDSDIRVKNGDKVICFCSYDCREKYLKQIGHEPSSIETQKETDWDEDE